MKIISPARKKGDKTTVPQIDKIASNFIPVLLLNCCQYKPILQIENISPPAETTTSSRPIKKKYTFDFINAKKLDFDGHTSSD